MKSSFIFVIWVGFIASTAWAATPADQVAPNYSVLSLYSPGIQIISLSATMAVPSTTPPAYGFISLWPGLDNVEAMAAGNNILHQPIIQWGGNCTVPSLPQHEAWLAEAFYYSDAQEAAGQHGGCNGGEIISVNPGDTLKLSISLIGSTWKQSITDLQTGQSSTFTYSMESVGDQYPDRVNFDIEIWNSLGGFNNDISSLNFTDVSFSATTPFPTCELSSWTSPTNSTTGKNTYSTPTVLNNGKTCSYKSITVYPMTSFLQP
jgi:hypothetical protein